MCGESAPVGADDEDVFVHGEIFAVAAADVETY